MLISRGCPWAIIQEWGLNLEKVNPGAFPFFFFLKGCGCSFTVSQGISKPWDSAMAFTFFLKK